MIFGIALLLIQIVFGLSLFGFFDPENKFSLLEFVLSSAVAGITIGSFLILALALVTQSLNLAIAIYCIIAFFVILLSAGEIKKIYALVSRASKGLKQLKLFFRPWVLILAAVILIYCLTISTVLFRDHSGSLKSALVSWGDTALHVSLIQRFATADPFVLSHPLLGGANLTYPFLIDFISGIFSKLGMDQVSAFGLPLYVLGVVWIILIFSLAARVLNSKLFASIALALIILGSGLGFTTFFKDLGHGYSAQGVPGIFATIGNPPHDYTHLNDRTGGVPQEKATNDNIVWIVPLISFFAHQRSFTLGLAIFMIILLGIHYYGNEKVFWRFGLFAGLLPLSHGHTFLAVFFLMAALFWFFLNNWKSWFLFAAHSAFFALPQLGYFYLSSKLINLSSFRPYFGWMTCEHNISWYYCDSLPGTDSSSFIFWSKNFGIIFWIWAIVMILAVLTLLFLWPLYRSRVKNNFNIKFLFASFIIFAAANLLVFQPWSFDNNKVLFYWWLLAVIFAVAPVLKLLWGKLYLGKTLVIVIIFFCIIAGSLDVLARIRAPEDSGYFGYSDGSKENRDLATWIKINTKPNDLFLTDEAVDPVPLFLAGRPVYISFEGWLWSEGLDYGKNRDVVFKILSGDLGLACRENIKYIMLNSGLKNMLPGMDDNKLISQTKTVYPDNPVSGGVRILELSCPLN